MKPLNVGYTSKQLELNNQELSDLMFDKAFKKLSLSHV